MTSRTFFVPAAPAAGTRHRASQHDHTREDPRKALMVDVANLEGKEPPVNSDFVSAGKRTAEYGYVDCQREILKNLHWFVLFNGNAFEVVSGLPVGRMFLRVGPSSETEAGSAEEQPAEG